MRRQLPPRPHLDHLKKQAKDLLDDHQRADPTALERIRDALPAFASRSPDDIAHATFALHDAQSTIAREYGFASWRELRAEVVSRTGGGFSEENLRAVWRQFAAESAALPQDLFAAIGAAFGDQHARAEEARRSGLPRQLPLLSVRNHLLLPNSVAPFHLARPVSLAAVDAACKQAISSIAVFAQRAETDDDITLERLHPIGVHALVRNRVADAQGGVHIVLQALRPIALDAVEQPTQEGAPRIAHIRAFELNVTDGAAELPVLDHALRELALQLTAALPEPEPARALIDELDDGDLADLVVANLPCAVPEKAAFAAEPRLVERLRIALQLTQRLTAAGPSPR